jgi:hypothetical protein
MDKIRKLLIKELGETEKEIHVSKLRKDNPASIAFFEGKKEGLKIALDLLNQK